MYEKLFVALGADISQGQGSRVRVKLNDVMGTRQSCISRATPRKGNWQRSSEIGRQELSDL